MKKKFKLAQRALLDCELSKINKKIDKLLLIKYGGSVNYDELVTIIDPLKEFQHLYRKYVDNTVNK